MNWRLVFHFYLFTFHFTYFCSMKFPAKLLLFGEHTVNLPEASSGQAPSQALAIPLWRFGGEWRFLPKEKMSERAGRQMDLPQFAEHLFRLRQNGQLPGGFDVEGFQNDLSTGLYFESDIPTGYGAGSSGALVAAVFSRYIDSSNFENLTNLKWAFAKMESFFHGKSSGTDPLVCFLQKPVLLSKTEVKEAHLSPLTSHFFLIDTGIRREATPFIEYFLEQNESKSFQEKCAAELLPAVDEGIRAYLTGDEEILFESVHRIGGFQLEYLEKIIPPAFHHVWQEGLSSDLFKLKVCGAGGGGFILGVTRDFGQVKNTYTQINFLKVE